MHNIRTIMNIINQKAGFIIWVELFIFLPEVHQTCRRFFLHRWWFVIAMLLDILEIRRCFFTKISVHHRTQFHLDVHQSTVSLKKEFMLMIAYTVCFLVCVKKCFLIPRAWKISMTWNIWHPFTLVGSFDSWLLK